MARDAWFESQYNARAAVPGHVEIFARCAEASRRARLQLPCYLDIAYGEGELESLDIFPSRGPSRALLSFIHGGYWRSRDKSEFSFLAPALCAAGFTLAIPNYALCPAVSIEHIVRQMLKAHAWLYRHAGLYGSDGSKLIVCGHSAGGHLAAMMAACDWPDYASGLPPDLVKAALPTSGIYDLMPLRRTSMNADLRLDENAARVASPVTYRPARPVPMVAAVGGEESNEFRRQCRLLHECWPHCVREALAVPGLNHFTLSESLADPRSVLFRALERLADEVR
ncbi:MAG: alpha/beta hydrolase [Burkholderiales bacterium]|nr:alpha/beta hydrolase [Burkholderiales bacterium]